MADLDVARPAVLAPDDTRTLPVAIVARRRIGETDVATHPIAFGVPRLAGLDEKTARDLLDRFVGRGGTLVDVTSGSETLVGEWLARRSAREGLLLSARAVAGVEAGASDRPIASGVLVRSVEAALRRLRSDAIDLLAIDLRLPGMALEEGLAAADCLVASGSARYVAIAGATADDLLSARVLAGAGGLPRIAAVLGDWSILEPSPFEGELRLAIAAQQLAVIPDATLVTSLLTRRAGRRSRVVLRAADLLGRGRPRIAATLDRIADEQRSHPASVALAWQLAKRSVAALVVRATSAEQLDAAMDAAALRLSRAQVLDLDRVAE